MPEEDEDLFVPADADADQEGDPPETPEPEETEIVIEGEDAPPVDEDSERFRELRRHAREQAAEIARLKAASAPKPVEVGPKPTLEAFEYDEEKYDAALLDWNNASAQARATADAEKKRREEANKAWQTNLDAFDRNKAALGVKDFAAAEEAVTSTLSQVQQAIILQGSEESAPKVIYALGKRPEKLAELAKITDPVKFARAIFNLEGTITVTKRRPPEPDTPIRGSGRLSTPTDAHMQKLEKEADRTGDRSKVIAYRRERREKAAAKGSR